MSLKQDLIRLGLTNPELRPHIRPLLRVAAKVPPAFETKLFRLGQELASWVERKDAASFMDELRYRLEDTGNYDNKQVEDLLWQVAKETLGWRSPRDQKDLNELSEMWKSIS